MDAKAILDGLLDKTQRATQDGISMAEDKSIIPPAGNERMAMLKGARAGALAAGAVALLFGSKGTHKFAKKAARLGGTAALGNLAYKAYTEWQAQQQGGQVGEQSTAAGGTATSASASQAFSGKLNLDQFGEIGTPIAKVSEIDATLRSESIIQAMISAARADGHIDDAELALIRQQINSLGLEKDVTAFLLSELNKPVSVASVAALADT